MQLNLHAKSLIMKLVIYLVMTWCLAVAGVRDIYHMHNIWMGVFCGDKTSFLMLAE